MNYAEASKNDLLAKSEQMSYADPKTSGQPVKCQRMGHTDAYSQVKSHGRAADVGKSGPAEMIEKLSYADAAKGE